MEAQSDETEKQQVIKYLTLTRKQPTAPGISLSRQTRTGERKQRKATEPASVPRVEGGQQGRRACDSRLPNMDDGWMEGWPGKSLAAGLLMAERDVKVHLDLVARGVLYDVSFTGLSAWTCSVPYLATVYRILPVRRSHGVKARRSHKRAKE